MTLQPMNLTVGPLANPFVRLEPFETRLESEVRARLDARLAAFG